MASDNKELSTDYLNVEDINKICGNDIMDIKDYREDFPKVQQYIASTTITWSKLFKFRYFNIYSHMLFLNRDGYSSLYWVIDDNSFDPLKDDSREETLQIIWNKDYCEIAEISTQNCTIPKLIIHKTTYTGYSVCMILALAFIYKLNISKVNLLDASHVITKCVYTGEEITTFLLESRILAGGNSIYAKFGFHTQEKPTKEICKVTIGEILDEYKERITIIEKDIENTNIPKGLYNTSNWKTKIFNVVLIIKTLLKLSKDMTIEEWLKQIEVGDRRNYRAFLIGQLYTYPFSIDFVYKGKYFPSTTFATIYRENTNNDMINEDITETYQTILSK